MVSLRDVLKSPIAGRADALALVAIMAGGFLTLPGLFGTGIVGVFSAVALAGAGGAMLGKRLAGELRINAFQYKDALEINSSELPPFDPDGVNIGVVGDRAEPLTIPLAEWMRHSMIVGQSGVGKTVLGEHLMFQQIRAGGGLIWIDGKLDPANLLKLWQMACWCGRTSDVLVINPGDPAVSNTYNPLLDGDPDEIAARCVSLIPTAENNAGADYYRQNATIAINTLVAAIHATGMRFDFADLRVLLSNSRALESLVTELERGHHDDEALALNLFLEQFRIIDKKSGMKRLDIDRVKQTFGGLGSRLAQFGSGSFGQVMNSYAPEVRLAEAVEQGKILYVMLPTMGKNEAAVALARLTIADFRSAVAKVQALPEGQRPRRPFLGFFDEAGSYVTQAWSRMFEQARSARLVMVPAFQTKANLETLGPELRAMVSGNTLTKVFFKPGEPEVAQWMSEMIGKEMQVQRGISAGSSDNKHPAALKDRVGKGAVDGRSFGDSLNYSESAKEGFKVTPDDLAKLGKGECIVLHDGHRVFKVHVPRLTFTPEFAAKAGPFRLNHPPVHDGGTGLDMLKRAREFLSE